MRTEKRPPISGGSLFSRSFQVFFATLPQFFFLALLILSPLVVFHYQLFSQPEKTLEPTRFFLPLLAHAVLSNILTGALVYGVFQRLAGQRVLIGECVAQAMRRFFLILMVSFLFSLIVGFGFVLLLIPGLFFMTLFCLAVPVAMVEGGTPISALQRSKELTRGHRWDVFIVLVLIGLCLAVFNELSGYLIVALGPSDPLFMAIIMLVCSSVIGVLSAVTPTVIYHDLRAVKDGFSVEDLSAVFE